jgi:V8-like Glu-specific endopeptidase
MRSIHRSLCGVGTFVAASVLLAPSSAAQVQAPPSDLLAYYHDSGPVANEGTAPEVVVSFPVVVQDAPWMRLSFAEVELSGDLFAGTGSILRLTSVRDGAVQELNELHVTQWRQTSAYFNGDMVLVEVLAHPGTGANRVVLEAVTAGEEPKEDSQCGPTDDRVLSSDPRAARILPIGCTGWLIDDCASCALTAGHCTSGTQVLQFNVPLSTSGGSIVSPPPQDQYAVDPASLQSNGGQGVGDDWGYYGCFPNSNTGLTPFEAQGARYTLASAPPYNSNENIRITGYGVDSSPSSHNQVQQTNAGQWVTSTSTTVQYKADTEGGNSGSPVIHDPSGVAIGIHTHGGCSTGGSGQNSGTASTHSGLQAALASPLGICEGSINIVGSLPSVIVPGVQTTVGIQVSGTITPGSAKLHVRYDGGTFSAQTMTDAGGGLFQSTLLAGSCTDTPEFYFSVDHTTCGPLTTPGNAPATVFGALVGTGTQVFGDDFETDTGWTTLAIGATSGHWERGAPVNDPNWAYDPMSDADGSGQAYVTQNQNGNTDIDNGTVRLDSPSIDMTVANVLVRYSYFLNIDNEDGTDRIQVKASNSGPSGNFTEITRHDTSGGLAWQSNVLTPADFAAAGVSLTNDMVFRFASNDGDPQSINESGIDGFDVSSVVCGDVGETYCSSNAATISASGSASVAANDLVLKAEGVAPNKAGIFIYSMTAQSIPFGNGTRCVGPSSTFRLQGLLNSGAGGVLQKSVDYNTLVPAGMVTAGDTWYFQAWFRAGGSFDLSDGVKISFTQ